MNIPLRAIRPFSIKSKARFNQCRLNFNQVLMWLVSAFPTHIYYLNRPPEKVAHSGLLKCVRIGTPNINTFPFVTNRKCFI